jgi:hypothetical protein
LQLEDIGEPAFRVSLEREQLVKVLKRKL